MARSRRHPVSVHPSRVEFLGSFPGRLPATGRPEVAFAGRSNVGKSSAINALLGRKKAARVSGRPGRTRAINLFEVDGRLCFADLPGYGFAEVPGAMRRSWKRMVERYLGERETLRLVLLLVDSRIPAQEIDAELCVGLLDADVPFRVVATKVDKLSKAARRPTLERLAVDLGAPLPPIPFSSITFEGVDAVWAEVRKACDL